MVQKMGTNVKLIWRGCLFTSQVRGKKREGGKKPPRKEMGVWRHTPKQFEICPHFLHQYVQHRKISQKSDSPLWKLDKKEEKL